jgi:hypothetical protein
VRRRSRQVCGGAGLRFDVSSSGLQREEGVRERERERCKAVTRAKAIFHL